MIINKTIHRNGVDTVSISMISIVGGKVPDSIYLTYKITLLLLLLLFRGDQHYIGQGENN